MWENKWLSETDVTGTGMTECPVDSKGAKIESVNF